MTLKHTQQQKILQLLRKVGRNGVNSFDLTYKYAIKQGPTRINELKEQGYKIASLPIKGSRAVNYVLTQEKTKKYYIFNNQTNTVKLISVNTPESKQQTFL